MTDHTSEGSVSLCLYNVSHLALSYCIYVQVLSPPLNIAYSQAIIIHLTVSALWTLFHDPFFNILDAFLVNKSPLHLFFCLKTLHPSPPFLLLPLYTFISFPQLPSLLPFVRPTFLLSSLYLVLSPFLPSFPPSLCPDSVYNMPLFSSAFLPLPSFSSCFCSLANFSPSRQTPYPLSPHTLKAWPWNLWTEGPFMVMGRGLETGASQAER